MNDPTKQTARSKRSGAGSGLSDAATLKAQTDLVDYIGRHVSLKKVGREFEGNCCFHEDSTPSFKVDPTKQLWNCMAGCGGGDLWSFIQKVEGLDFKNAVRFLAEKTGTTFRPPPPATKTEAVWVPTLPISDNAPPPPSHHYKLGVPSERWLYRDTAGLPMFHISRFDKPEGGKEFLPLTWCHNRKTGKTEWRWQGAPAPRPLYHLDQLTNDHDSIVVVTEGERKCVAATTFLPGTVGTTSANGSGSAGKTDWKPLAGRDVILWLDNDQAGRAYGDEVTRLLKKVGAKSIRIINPEFFLRMPDGSTRDALPAKWDAYDAQREGFTAEHGQKLMADPGNFLDVQVSTETPTKTMYEQATSKDDGTDRDGHQQPVQSGNMTQMGLAERYVLKYGETTRYCYPFKKWFEFDDKRWCEDRGGTITGYAKTVVREIYQEAAQTNDYDMRQKLSKFAVKSEQLREINAMLSLAQSDVSVLPEKFDAYPMLFNVANGTIDLKTGKLRPHNKKDFIRKISEIPFDPNATAPTWEKFLQDVFAGDEAVIHFVQKAIGYSMTASTEEQCLFFLHGGGRNGKSVFTETIQSVIGDYSTRLPSESLMAKKNGDAGVPNDIAKLAGMRFVVSSEISDEHRLNEAKVKDLTGSDTILARFLFAEFFEFKPTHKFWIFGNHKPNIRGTDHGIWRRIRLIPFKVTFTDETADKKFGEKLLAEQPGILKWMVDGCLSWQREGLKSPAAVADATAEYRSEMDVIGPFILERCTTVTGSYAKSGNLFNAYQAWCKETGTYEVSQTKFGKYLTERGFKQADPVRIGGKPTRLRYGIGLLSDESVTGSPPPVTGCNANSRGNSKNHATRPRYCKTRYNP